MTTLKLTVRAPLLTRSHIISATMRSALFGAFILLVASSGYSAPRTHTIVLGKWRSVEAHFDSGTIQPIKVRELVVDGVRRDYVMGPVHDVTDEIQVVRRVYHLNDALPQETARPQPWAWRPGGWISVNRLSGRVISLNMAAFDSEVSLASWYRDFAAYCGTSDDGVKTYMVVAQLGKRKPILRKETTASSCAVSQWERMPSRVTFVVGSEKMTFSVRSHGADLQPESTEEEGQQ